MGYFLTIKYKYNPNPGCHSSLLQVSCSGYYDYYYSRSANGGSNYYFLEDNTKNIQGDNGGSKYFPFMPLDQQHNSHYSQYGVFWLYNWFQVDSSNNMMNIYFLMNGNIFNYSLASKGYQWNGGSAYAIPPNPPANTINGEPIFAQSYINAYNTAFNQPYNQQNALYKYQPFTWGDVNNNNFVPGTFGYREQYNAQGVTFTVNPLEDDASYYDVDPYLFISAGSGDGSGYMYLDWVIVTYGVPYVASVS